MNSEADGCFRSEALAEGVEEDIIAVCPRIRFTYSKHEKYKIVCLKSSFISSEPVSFYSRLKGQDDILSGWPATI